MKRLAVVVVALILASALLPAEAQAQNLNPLRSIGKLGFKIGYIGAQLDGERDAGSFLPSPDYGSKAGFGGGVFLVGNFNAFLALQSEVLYLERRTESTVDTPLGPVTNTIKAQYLQVPVQLKLSFSEKGNWSPFIMAGPAFAYRVGLSADGGNDGLVDPEDIKFETKKKDIEIVVTAGFEIQKKFTIEGRYTWGTNNFFTDAKNAEYKWRELSFYASYHF
jgi:hypothetical protein